VFVQALIASTNVKAFHEAVLLRKRLARVRSWEKSGGNAAWFAANPSVRQRGLAALQLSRSIMRRAAAFVIARARSAFE